MSKILVVDVIEVVKANSIQVREKIFYDGEFIKKYQRHRVEHICCENEHPLAHALRAALPMEEPVDYTQMPDGKYSSPDFIRIEVNTGRIRYDMYNYWVDNGEVIEHVSSPILVHPGDDPSGHPEKVITVCDIVFSPLYAHLH